MRNIEVILKREYLEDRTLGTFTIFEDNTEIGRMYSMERAWLNNKRSVSCIPEGDYLVEPNDTKAHPDTYRVLNVKGRSGILIHIGNYPKHSEGCILLGQIQADLDKDGIMDIGATTGLKDLGDNEQAGYIFSATRPTLSTNNLFFDGTHTAVGGKGLLAQLWEDELIRLS